MECGGFWFYPSNQSSTQGVILRSTTPHLHPMPTCLPSSNTLPWCPRPICTQGWQVVWATWALSTSPSIILISTQSRVSWMQQNLMCIITLWCHVFVLSLVAHSRPQQNHLVQLTTAPYIYVLLIEFLVYFSDCLSSYQTGFYYVRLCYVKCCPFGHSVSADSHSQHGRPTFVHRDDRTNKTYERLQKKLKERQGGGGQVKDSPPPSPQKTCSSPPAADVHNGVSGKGLEAEQGQLSHAVAGPDKQAGRGKNGESRGKEVKGQRFGEIYSWTFSLSSDIRTVLDLDCISENSNSLAAAANDREGSAVRPTLFLMTQTLAAR